jgi:hypothetical protein
MVYYNTSKLNQFTHRKQLFPNFNENKIKKITSQFLTLHTNTQKFKENSIKISKFKLSTFWERF